ncbi:MAG: hypothetical protein P4L58_03985, partial [Candidatus Pacebacteria bacterium]|nr:hypothetical protein [Candidatus Paceibacterota bacterium]
MKINLKNKLIIIFSVAVCAAEVFNLFFNFTSAQVVATNQSPSQIAMTAYIINTQDQEIKNGKYAVAFAIYSTDRSDASAPLGTPLWQEAQNVEIDNGILSAYLGAATSLPANLNFGVGQYFLGIKIGTDAEMVPRKRIGAVPLAIDAMAVNGATVGNGAGNLVSLGANGKVNIQNLPTGTSGNTLVLSSDKRLTASNYKITISGQNYASASGLKLTLNQINLGSNVTGTLPVKNGGTGLDGSTAASGTILIGNGSGYALNTLTAGTGIAIDNSTPGHITISSTDTGYWTLSGFALYASNISYNVGIGTNNPSAKLDVAGDIALSGNIVAENANENIGSLATRFNYGYFENLDVANLNIGGINVSGTNSNTFTINSSNTTNDQENSFLAFSRGENGGTQNNPALIQWDHANQQFVFNFPTNIQGVVTSSGFTLGGQTVTNWIGNGLAISGGSLSLSEANGYHTLPAGGAVGF